MLLYVGNSRWTSAGRNHAVHIADENRRPLCAKEYKNGALDVWEGSIDEVTCHDCLRIIAKRITALMGTTKE
jgi:hypothetical protein